MGELGLEWRPLTAGDAEAVERLRAASEAADDMGESYGAEEFTEDLGSSAIDVERGTVGVFTADRLVAMAMLYARTAADPVHEMFLWGTVRPDMRGHGIGGGLLAWADRAAPEISGLRFPGAPVKVQTPAYDKMRDHCALLESFGYKTEHYDFGMERKISARDAQREPGLPSGFALVPFDQQVSEEFRATHNEAFVPDHPGSTVATPETWSERVGSASFRSDLSYGLRDSASGRLAGYVLCYHFEADAKATGRRDVYFNYIGTRREFRGRGVAGGLIAHVVYEAAKQGFESASLGVFEHNPTGALGVYRRAGFEVLRTFVDYAKPLS